MIKKNVTDKSKLLKLEQDFVISSKKRLEVISGITSKIDKNQLILFHRQEYGKTVRDFLKENTDKEIYFIYGSTPKDERVEIINKMKENTASIGCYRAGCFEEKGGVNVARVAVGCKRTVFV